MTNTLTQSLTQPSVYRINAPAFAAALTRSGGDASDSLCTKIAIALGMNIASTKLRFARGDSGKWYVQTGTQDNVVRAIYTPHINVACEGFANEHNELLIESTAGYIYNEFVYDEHVCEDGTTLYWAEKDGFVSYYAHNPANEEGFGGSTFTLNMSDGTERKVKGPWSSRASVMNEYFPHCMEAVFRSPTGGLLAINVTVEMAELMASMVGAEITQDDHLRYSLKA